MKNWIKREWFLLLVLAVPFVFIASVWPQIPERMPIHFNAAFRPNGWMNKPWAPLLMPLSSVLVILVIKLFFHFDPKMAKCDADTRLHVRRVLDRFLLVMAVFLAACSITMIWAAWGDMQPVVCTICYGVPLLYLVLGNSLGKLRPNYTLGIRVRWTLESPAVWTKTHRMGGRLLVIVSALLLLQAITKWHQDEYLWILVGSLLGWALVVAGYAFVLSRKETEHARAV